MLRKQHDGRGAAGEPTTVDAILAGDIDLIVNTPYGVGARLDGYEIRTAAVTRGVPCITTVQGLAADGAGHRGADPGGDRRTVPAGVGDRSRGLRAAQATSGTGSSDTTGSSTSEGGAR